MSSSPGSLVGLRQRNRRSVLSSLEELGQASRAEIARATGLSATAVTSLTAELLAEGTVVERRDAARPPASPNGGRPPTLLSLEHRSGGFVGICFAHDHVRAAIVDRSGSLMRESQVELDVDHRPDDSLGASVTLVTALLTETEVARDRVGGIGVALSAPTRSDHGRFESPRVFTDWNDIDVASALSSQLGVDVHVGNDANLGGLAEATIGAGRGEKNLIYIMLSAGVGAALVLDGKLYEGETGTAGEFGHIVVDPSGAICRCGNRGCLETIASSTAVVRTLGRAHDTRLAFSDLIELLGVGDPPARRVLVDAGRAVGGALAAMCTMLDPGLIIVGGELAVGGDALLDGMRETIGRETSVTGSGYTLVRGKLGPSAEVIGAALLAKRRAAV